MRVAPASNPNPLAYAYLQAAERLGYHHSDDLNGAAKNCARKPTWSAACSTGIETTGRSRCRPMTSAISRTGMPSSATLCSRMPGIAESTASRNSWAASMR